MPARTAEAMWNGNLQQGKGNLKVGSGAFEGAYDWRSRSADGSLTNPEELIGAAHAGCFSMALAATLTSAGVTPQTIHTIAKVHLEKADGGFVIPKIELSTEVSAQGLEDAKFQELAETAKVNCPVSKALGGVSISLTAKLV